MEHKLSLNFSGDRTQNLSLRLLELNCQRFQTQISKLSKHISATNLDQYALSKERFLQVSPTSKDLTSSKDLQTLLFHAEE